MAALFVPIVKLAADPWILLLFLATVILIAVAFFYVSSIIATPPNGRAIDLTEQERPKIGRVVACIGDSLTHGNIGVCWVESLRQEFPKDIFLNELRNFVAENNWRNQLASYCQ